MILRDLLLPGGGHADISLHGGRIDSLNPGTPSSGYAVLPAPVEPHAHIDKAFTADRIANPTGDLPGAVRGWLAHRPTLSEADIRSRAERALRAYLRNGATHVRTHVDIGDDIGLLALHALKGLPGLQTVAFAANPLSGVAGARNRELLREAVAAGAGAVGACPALDPDPAACIEFVLDCARASGVPVDMHVDEGLEPDPCTLELLARAAIGVDFPVAASHCVSLAMLAPRRRREVAALVARAGIAVICLPQTNLYLQGRGHEGSPPRGLTALRELREAGVTVAAGGDNLQDPFNPLGRADPLETAALLVLAGHESPEAAYDAVSNAARRAIGLPEVTLTPGAPADLLLVRAGSLREAIASAPASRVVIRDGRVVARTTAETEFPAC